MTHEKMPEALRLADDLDENADLDAAEGGNPDVCKLEHEAAAELRRQHAEIERLRAEVEGLSKQREPMTDEFIDSLWTFSDLTIPQIVNRRVIARTVEAALQPTKEQT